MVVVPREITLPSTILKDSLSFNQLGRDDILSIREITVSSLVSAVSCLGAELQPLKKNITNKIDRRFGCIVFPFLPIPVFSNIISYND
jgi:hypothetical protein